MAIQQINIGAAPNDKTGDKARDWAQKTNANFTNPDHAASKIMATPPKPWPERRMLYRMLSRCGKTTLRRLPLSQHSAL